MPTRKVTDEEREKIRKLVQREFPWNKCLQDIHYYRYILELEWEAMRPEEILSDIREGARRLKEEIKNLDIKMKQ